MPPAAGASFAQFFPAAPRAAKDKAKEREKVKSHLPESASISSAADTQSAITIPRVEHVTSHQYSSQSNIPVADSAPPPLAEDNDYQQGDLLNGVGSASSHTSSSVSSVFSAPTQHANMSTFGGPRNVSNLTPLTNTDSSPHQVTSPNQYKSGARATTSSGATTDNVISQNIAAPAQNALAEQNPTAPRIYARDPNKAVKGEKCIYDPLVDNKLNDREKKKAKAIYKDFGLVRTHIICRGSVILFVRLSG